MEYGRDAMLPCAPIWPKLHAGPDAEADLVGFEFSSVRGLADDFELSRRGVLALRPYRELAAPSPKHSSANLQFFPFREHHESGSRELLTLDSLIVAVLGACERA